MPDDSLRVEYNPFSAGRPASPDAPAESPEPGRKPRRLARRAMVWLLLAAAAVTLPFVLLIRLSVWIYTAYGIDSWLSLAAGASATVLLLCLYLVVLRWRVRGRPGFSRWGLRGVGVVVGGYCVYALVYMSAGVAKTEGIRGAYRSLDPLLRVATSTILLVDRDAVVTDLQRTAENYAAWGLAVNEASLHLTQDDGFVHAADLRTIGRPEWRNRLVEAYYRVMGFRTLRHVGTADHLHVSLPLS